MERTYCSLRPPLSPSVSRPPPRVAVVIVRIAFLYGLLLLFSGRPARIARDRHCPVFERKTDTDVCDRTLTWGFRGPRQRRRVYDDKRTLFSRLDLPSLPQSTLVPFRSGRTSRFERSCRRQVSELNDCKSDSSVSHD